MDRVFSAKDKQTSLNLIDEYSKIWQRVVGTRGYTGDRAMNSHTQFDQIFSLGGSSQATDELDIGKLEQLEESLTND